MRQHHITIKHNTSANSSTLPPIAAETMMTVSFPSVDCVVPGPAVSFPSVDCVVPGPGLTTGTSE